MTTIILLIDSTSLFDCHLQPRGIIQNQHLAWKCDYVAVTGGGMKDLIRSNKKFTIKITEQILFVSKYPFFGMGGGGSKLILSYRYLVNPNTRRVFQNPQSWGGLYRQYFCILNIKNNIKGL